MSEPQPKPKCNSYERDQVVKIINSVISKVEGVEHVSKDVIAQELSGLKKIIEEARAEIGQTQPSDITGKHIPTATDELDAVVEATAEATGSIMDACEVIEEKAGTLDSPVGGEIAEQVTKVYEACSFQDITGQRITKVVGSLKAIEEKVDALLKIFDAKMPGVSDGSAAGDTRKGDEKLLNGPQLPNKGVTQDDIDKLLEEFDG